MATMETAVTEAAAVETVKAYFRCPTCLSVYLTRVPTPPKVADRWAPVLLDSNRRHLLDHAPVCGICEVGTEPMGVVGPSGKGVTLTTTDTVCDWSCQMAMGPFCDCKCQGANHGDRLARKIIVLEHRATHPVVTVEDPAAAKARALEFTAAVEAARVALKARFVGIDDVLARKARGEWVDARAFALLLAHNRAYRSLDEAKTLKTHKSRMARLAGLLAPEKAGTE